MYVTGLNGAINIYLFKINESMSSFTINSNVSNVAKLAKLNIQVLLWHRVWNTWNTHDCNTCLSNKHATRKASHEYCNPLSSVVSAQCNFNYTFIHLIVCLMTGPKPLPKWAPHIVWSRTSSFKWEYPLLSLRSSNSFLHLLPCLAVTSIPLVSFLQ
jgi:hypothetical protein